MGRSSGRTALAAIDLGATSGRVMLGLLTEEHIELVAAHRFSNGPCERDGHLVWDIDALWGEIRRGLTEAERLAREHGLDGITSIGIDSWAVDYALVGPDRVDSAGHRIPATGERIGEVICYRDPRTDGVGDRLAAQMSRERQYALTGIAQQPFNTLYQLAAEDRLVDLPPGSSLLLVPDYVAFLLTGERRTEVTNASTTGLLDVRTRTWSPELLAAAGIGRSLLAPLVEPGERCGTVRPELAAELGIGRVPVVAVASHDTASAVLAVPAVEEPVAYISSGTWSLAGLELAAPIPTEGARREGFTNEAGVGGSTRFLQNVMGMWLVSQCIAQWAEDGRECDLATLLAGAAAAGPAAAVLDVTDPRYLPPGRMADRVVLQAIAAGAGPETLASPAQVVRLILDSLARAYRRALHRAAGLADVSLPRTLHIVGGGSQNALLNQLTADALGVEVVAGPVEATALGNLAVQAHALGALDDDPQAMRNLVRRSVELRRFRPAATSSRAR
jgi:rhamnulokinase